MHVHLCMLHAPWKDIVLSLFTIPAQEYEKRSFYLFGKVSRTVLHNSSSLRRENEANVFVVCCELGLNENVCKRFSNMFQYCVKEFTRVAADSHLDDLNAFQSDPRHNTH
jgi:hypothetical protein